LPPKSAGIINFMYNVLTKCLLYMHLRLCWT